jgi:hypothetical protein
MLEYLCGLVSFGVSTVEMQQITWFIDRWQERATSFVLSETTKIQYRRVSISVVRL